MSQKLRITLVGAVLLVGTAASAAQLNHPGGFCRANGGGAVIYYNQGAVGNDSYSSVLHVLCPVVRFSNATKSGTPQIHTIDRSTTAGIECSYYDVRAYGHAWDWSGWTTSVGSGTNNYRTFTFGNGTNDDPEDGVHNFYCKIPKKDATYGVSIIGSYSSGD